MRTSIGSLLVAATLLLAAPATAADAITRTSAPTGNVTVSHQATTPIQHFVFLMQGDRSFDNYFSTYPGVNAPPPKTCQALVLKKPGNGCVRPFPLHGKDVKPLAPGNAVLNYQYDGGRLDGFVAAYLRQGRDGTAAMGYYDRRDLPFYWAVADRYVLFDNFFSAARQGIRANRSYWVSAAPEPSGSQARLQTAYDNQVTIFDRLQSAGLSWKFYVQGYDRRQTFRARSAAGPVAQTTRVPLLNYPRFVDDPAMSSHIVDLSEYYRDAASGTLPAVSYISSSGASERSGQSIASGQQLVKRLITQLTMSSQWSSSAFLWTYDGSGGWFDHVRPPTVRGEVQGLRVPALLVSPYAAQGRVDHTQLGYTSALRFIEDNWNLAALTPRDARATSLAGALRFGTPPRPATVIQLEPPPPGQRVRVGLAYLGYLVAAGVVLLIFVAALVGPSVIRALRRPVVVPPELPDPSAVLVGVVVTGEDR